MTDIFTYDPVNKLIAVCADPAVPNSRHRSLYLVLIGGMTDGPYSLPFSGLLIDECSKIGISVIQPVLRSSYRQYGVSSLNSDCEDIVSLCSYCHQKRGKDSEFILVGHSTGCSGIVWLLNAYDCVPEDIRNSIKWGVLQGPASDRQYMEWKYGADFLVPWINSAKELICSGKGRHLMSSTLNYEDGVPISAYRFYSLASPHGDDDMFSTDEAGSRSRERLFHRGKAEEVSLRPKVPLAVYISENDEYVPTTIPISGISSAMGSIPGVNHIKIIKEANHDLSNVSDEDLRKHFIMDMISWTEKCQYQT